MRTWDELRADASSCTRCALSQGRSQVVFGVGDRDAGLMFVGEAPGFHEDRRGEPFVGRAGQLLDTLCAEVGLSRGDGVYIANVLKCRPPDNRDPLPDEIETCKPFLLEQVAHVDPRVIVTLGAFATRLLLADADPGPPDPARVSVGKVAGYRFHVHGRTLIPTFHPAAALRGNAAARDALRRDLRLAADVIAGRVPTAAQALGLDTAARASDPAAGEPVAASAAEPATAVDGERGADGADGAGGADGEPGRVQLRLL